MTGLVRAGLPPGPRSPSPLQTLRMLRDPYGFLLDCHQRFGDLFTVRMIPCGTMIYVADPGHARAVLGDPTADAGAINAYMTPLLGDGLLTLDGERHARHRGMIEPALSTERSLGRAGLIAEETERELAGLPIGRELALRPHLERIALRVLRRLLVGDAAAGVDELMLRLKRRSVADAAAALVGRRLGLRGEAARLVAELDRALLAEIGRRRAGGAQGDDVLAALLAARAPDGGALADRELRDELVTLLFAGHETVATTCAWAIERIVRHPDIHDRLAGAPGDDAYLGAAIKETMRQRSCLPDVGRRLAAPRALGPWHLPAGTQVFPAIVPLHMRPDVYPEPRAFRPERFLGRRPAPGAYVPFGGGPRRCVGAALAMVALRAMLSTVLAQVRLRAAEPAAERGVGNGITIAPHRGARVVIAERRR